MRRLGMREHSRAELCRWLKGRFGKEPEVVAQIDEVVGRLVELELLSDDRYARMMTRHQFQRGKGPGYIQGKLREKGVSIETSTIRQWITEYSGQGDGEAEIEQARRLIERRYQNHSSDKKVAQKAFGALVRRGFSFDIARKALKAE